MEKRSRELAALRFNGVRFYSAELAAKVNSRVNMVTSPPLRVTANNVGADAIAGALGPALDFMRTLWRLNHALELVSGHMERELGITAQQRMVIRCLGKRPGIVPSELATLLHLDRSTISSALKRMERDGLLVRRSGTADRRRVTLWLSAKGKKLDQPSSETVESAVERTLSLTLRRDQLATSRVMACLLDQLELVCGVTSSETQHPADLAPARVPTSQVESVLKRASRRSRAKR